MKITKSIAKQLLEVHFGVNWTWSNLQDQLSDVTWEQANMKAYNLNSIVALVFHINYYVCAVIKVMNGGALDSKDKFSFDHPPIKSIEDWEKLKSKVFEDAKDFAELINQMPEDDLWKNVDDERYGNYYRNLTGIIEHSHYHLGQIAVIKKIIKKKIEG